jgi:short-subunit dehydrogenase
MRSLAGKVIVITGASSGIGAATSLACAKLKARLVLVARRRERLSEVAEAVRRSGGEALAVPLDVTDAAAADAMVRAAVAAWGRIDVLVNNAGRGLLAPFEETTPEELRQLMELNVISVMRLSQAVLPVMRRQGSGHLINISSIAGRRATPWRSAYSATKFALGGFSESLRQELRGTGIHVSLVYPVLVPTEFQEVELKKMSPRLSGPRQTPETVARAIVRCIQRPRVAVYPYRLAYPLAILSTAVPEAVDLLVARMTRTPRHEGEAPCSSR